MPSDKPLILFYTTFFSKPVNLAPLNGLIPDVSGQFTLDKRRIAEATAVVFHVPNFREMGDAFKHPGQYWIGWSMECRQNYKILADAKIMKRFDFTMTHETRSDVWAPYLPKASWWDQMMARPIPAKTEEAPIALFVSARLIYSGRISLLEELAAHIKMRNRTIEGPDLGRVTKQEIIGRYRFCMAVENSTEADYVTEKIYDCFLAGTVPIYLGAPNVDEFVPPGSYINAANFDSPADLAAYLRYLVETPQAYEEYFAWRSKPLPPLLLERARKLETPLLRRLMSFVEAQVEQRPIQPTGRRTLPFGLHSYVSTRLRKLRKRVPS